jgi:hypothetical protein
LRHDTSCVSENTLSVARLWSAKMMLAHSEGSKRAAVGGGVVVGEAPAAARALVVAVKPRIASSGKMPWRALSSEAG